MPVFAGSMSPVVLLPLLLLTTSSAFNIIELNSTSPYNSKYDYELHIFEDLFTKMMDKYKERVEMDADFRYIKTDAIGQYHIQPPFNANITFDVDCGRGVFQDLYTIERASPAYIHDVRRDDGTFIVSALFNFSEISLTFPFFNFTCSRTGDEVHLDYVVFVFNPVYLRVTTSVMLRPVRVANVTAVEFPCLLLSASVFGNIDKKLYSYRKVLTTPLFNQFRLKYKPQVVDRLFEEFKKDIKLTYFDYYKK